MTPNPFPAMADAESQYATVEGITVWEGAVDESSDKSTEKIKGKVLVFKVKEGWQAVWRGDLPIGEHNSCNDVVQEEMLNL